MNAVRVNVRALYLINRFCQHMCRNILKLLKLEDVF